MVTSNHIHLLVVDGDNEKTIPRSLQLVEGRVAQEYNYRKHRKGAFWEDRYHATAVESGKHLARCMSYIDLNIGDSNFVKDVIDKLGARAMYREIAEDNRSTVLREPKIPYSASFDPKIGTVSPENSYYWDLTN